MKRGTALMCALMIVMMNTPAASAERNIVSTIRGADYTISVDADVYGEGTSGLQAYRVQTLDWGRNPETHFDLSLWFDADVPTEKADFDCTVFYPKGDETRLGERDEARFSPYGVSFMRATDARLTFPLDKWNYRRMQENPNAVQLPQGFALTGCGGKHPADCGSAGRGSGAPTRFRLGHDVGGLAGRNAAKA